MLVRGDEFDSQALTQRPNVYRYLEVEQTGTSSQFYDKFGAYAAIDPVRRHLTLLVFGRCSKEYCAHLQGHLEQPCSSEGIG